MGNATSGIRNVSPMISQIIDAQNVLRVSFSIWPHLSAKNSKNAGFLTEKPAKNVSQDTSLTQTLTSAINFPTIADKWA